MEEAASVISGKKNDQWGSPWLKAGRVTIIDRQLQPQLVIKECVITTRVRTVCEYVCVEAPVVVFHSF